MKTLSAKLQESAPRPRPPEKSIFRDYGEALGIAIILALIIRAFLFEAFSIPSGSMENTLLVGDYLLVNRLSYGIRNPFTNRVIIPLGTPKRGDVVVFIFTLDPSKDYINQPPTSIYRDNPAYIEPKDYIKRVIGLPGDKLQVINKKVFINDQEFKIPQAIFKDSTQHEEFIPADQAPRDNYGPVVVPPHCYFCMGDNRDRSFDSRFWGFVNLDAIKGKATIIYFSWKGPPGEPKFLLSLLGGLNGLIHHLSWDTRQFQVRWDRIGKIID